MEAAKIVFSTGGPQASLDAVARHAGVGIGTLYRHFPTRETLFEAVYRREVEQLVELSIQLDACPAPVMALRQWLRANVEFVATKKAWPPPWRSRPMAPRSCRPTPPTISPVRSDA